ncbi:MAG: hypothetical protein HC841_00435 [Verrucomicrobiae bacterium]|nr:hypothetical protein [Verrucomicrobiae bacterium]
MLLYVKRGRWNEKRIPSPEIRRGVRIWNSAFKIDWHSFRLEMADIAAESHACWPTERCREPSYGEFVLPLDDDDLVHPDAAAVLKNLVDNRAHLDMIDVQGFHWPVTTLGPDGLGSGAPNQRFFYGYTGQACFRWTPEREPFLWQHFDLEPWFRCLKEEERAGLGERLTVYVRHPAGHQSLRYLPEGCQEAERKLLSEIVNFKTAMFSLDCPEELAWVRPYAYRLGTLFASLLT